MGILRLIGVLGVKLLRKESTSKSKAKAESYLLPALQVESRSYLGKALGAGGLPSDSSEPSDSDPPSDDPDSIC